MPIIIGSVPGAGALDLTAEASARAAADIALAASIATNTTAIANVDGLVLLTAAEVINDIPTGTATYSNPALAGKVVNVDYLVWFYALGRPANSLEVINITGGGFILQSLMGANDKLVIFGDINRQPTNQIALWAAAIYQSGSQVNHLGKDWTANAITAATDIPGTSLKWTERLPGYSSVVIAIAKNLFNPVDIDVTTGFYVASGSGLLSANAAFTASGFIPVLPSTQYVMSYKNQFAWYTAAKVYISGDSSTVNNATIYTAPVNAAFLRVTIANTSLSVFQVEQNSVLSSYDAFTYKVVSVNGTVVGVNGSDIQTYLQTYLERPALIKFAPFMYVSTGKELSVYFENIVKHYNNYKGKVDVSIYVGGKQTGRSAKVVPGAVAQLVADVTIYNEKFEAIAAIPLRINASNPATVTAVKILNVGDSFTYLSNFITQLTSNSTTGLTFLGTRNVSGLSANVPGNLCEGRGGWTLANFFTARTDKMSPFMHPVAPYKYWGNTSFWIDANAVTPSYDAADFPAGVKGLFHITTGYLLAPAANDVIYDNVAAGYKVWDGSAWINIAAVTLAFAFNFAKYRTTWGIAQPNVLQVLLGTNDFGSTNETQTDALWITWKVQLDAFIAGVKADSPLCKIIVGIPVSSGRQGVDGNLATEKRKRAYWILAKNLISYYGGREAELIYLSDYHSGIDRMYAFSNASELPFADYSGADRDTYKSDFTHLSADGWKQMGNLYMGIIQYLR